MRKLTNEALQTVRREGYEFTLWCLGLTSIEVARLHRDDPERYQRVKRIRAAVGRQLALNTRNVAVD
jgi:hypothetical protein